MSEGMNIPVVPKLWAAAPLGSSAS